MEITMVVLSTKKTVLQFFKKTFCFSENLFQSLFQRLMKMFKIPTDCHIKTCQSLKLGTIIKIYMYVGIYICRYNSEILLV